MIEFNVYKPESADVLETCTLLSEWNELDQHLYNALITDYLLYINGILSAWDVQKNFVRNQVLLTGKEATQDELEHIAQNIVYLADKVTFIWKRDEGSDNYFLNTEKLSKNLVSTLKLKCKTLYGYFFEIKEGLIATDLTAEEFGDAMGLMESYLMRPDKPFFLAALVSVLYRESKEGVRRPYILVERYKEVQNIIDETTFSNQFAIFTNFQSILNCLIQFEGFRLIWSRKEEGAPKYNLGFSENINLLVSKGFGSDKEVKGMNIIDFLGKLLQIKLDNIREYLRLNKEDSKSFPLSKLVSETGLTAEELMCI